MPAPVSARLRSWPALALSAAGAIGLALALAVAIAMRVPPEKGLRTVTGTLTSFIKLDRRLEAWNHYELVVNPPRRRPELVRVSRDEITEQRLSSLLLKEVTALYDINDNLLYGLTAAGVVLIDKDAVRRQREHQRWRSALMLAVAGIAGLLAGLHLRRRTARGVAGPRAGG